MIPAIRSLYGNILRAMLSLNTYKFTISPDALGKSHFTWVLGDTEIHMHLYPARTMGKVGMIGSEESAFWFLYEMVYQESNSLAWYYVILLNPFLHNNFYLWVRSL